MDSDLHIITGEPNELIREIHTRMPVILPEDKLDIWLSGEAGKEILVPYPMDRMTALPISPRVNSPKNNDPGILEPVAVDQDLSVFVGPLKLSSQRSSE